jgi:hypothetical protein
VSARSGHSIALVLAALMGPASLARAEGAPDALAPSRLDVHQLDRALSRARARRNIGIGLGVPGIALTVLGGVLIGYGAVDPNLGSGGAEIGAGVISGVVGLLISVPGVVLWTLGQEDMDVIRWRKARLTVGPPHAVGEGVPRGAASDGARLTW